MKLNELLKTTPATLAEQQHKALKAHVIKKLSVVMTAIETENYKYIEKLTEHSYSGDGTGNENDYIEFAFEGSDSLDIGEVTEMLMSLKEVFAKSKK